MALPATTVFEVRTGGSDNNGGGFNSAAAGTDRSQQDAAHVVIDGVTISAVVAATTTDLTLTGHTAIAADIGNLVQITGGTATAGYYHIASIPDSATWRLDRSCGTAAQTATGNMGGALASPGAAGAALSVDLQNIWIKAGTYTLSTATPGKGGPFLPTSGIRFKCEGYTTTRGDRAGRPILNAGAQETLTLFSGQGSNEAQRFVHLEADGNSNIGVSGFDLTSNDWIAEDCIARNCNQTGAFGFACTGTSLLTNCKAVACTIGFTNGTPSYCWADACGVGFGGTAASGAFHCLATNCSGNGFGNTGNDKAYYFCTSEGNGNDGFDLAGNRDSAHFCVASNNIGEGFAVNNQTVIMRSASYGNAARLSGTPFHDILPILLTSDPWVDAANDDYRPNNVADGGALLRNIMGVSGQATTTDIGAVHHTASGGGTSFGTM